MKIVFAGSPDFAALALADIASQHQVVLVLTKEDSAVGRSGIITESAVATKAAELNLRVLKTNRVTNDVINEIASAGADRGIVIAFGALIPKPALELFPWWNLHFSLLPKWRGATPLQRSLQHNAGAGISLFQLDQGLDTGPIIVQEPMTFLPLETSGEALSRFSKRGTELILEMLGNPPIPFAQSGEVSYAPKFSKDEAHLDFTQLSEELERKIRAFNPEPIAYGTLAGARIRILKARSIGLYPWDALEGDKLKPGAFTQSGKNQILVKCGSNTALEIIEVQPAGKRVMNAGDWFRGQRAGTHFE